MAPSHKVCGFERLVALRDEARRAGRRVAHCHGCFDIVHPGHVHHLQYARSLGDLLVVSVSADPQVNKGVDRPLIPEDLRANNLAALECVDLVYVNPDPTAVGLLDALRPDVYVKGKEYENNHDPRFLAERDTVTGHGGRVVFSSGDLVLSSTGLIGGMHRPDVFSAEKVRRFRDKHGISAAAQYDLVNAFRGRRVLVVGDYILDRYHFCDATGVASEGPMMTLRAVRQADYDGGGAVIALHLAALGATPVLVTSLADDEASDEIEARLRSRGVETLALRQRRQVVAKHRYLADETKVFKVDEGSVAPLDSRDEAGAAKLALAAADGADAVIFADFGFGMLTAGLLDAVMPHVRARVGTVTADVSGRQGNLLRFKDVDLLCPTEREVRETLHDFSSGLNAVVWQLLSTTGARNALITLGKQGLVAFDQNKDHADVQAWERRLRSEYLPALSGRAIDPLGCGDALLATASLALAAGGSLHAAAFLGAVAASIEVEHTGNHPVAAEEIFARLQEWPDAAALARVA